MAKGKSPSKQDDADQDEAALMERMKEGFKRLLNTPPETHDEMVKRRRGRSGDVVHASDCAVHDAPAYEAGACTCGAETKARR